MFSPELLGALGAAAGDSIGNLATQAATDGLRAAGTVLEPYTKPALGSALGMNAAAPTAKPTLGASGVAVGVYSAANPPPSSFWGDDETTPAPMSPAVKIAAAVAVGAVILWALRKA